MYLYYSCIDCIDILYINILQNTSRSFPPFFHPPPRAESSPERCTPGTLGRSTGGLRSMGPGNYWPSNDARNPRQPAPTGTAGWFAVKFDDENLPSDVVWNRSLPRCCSCKHLVCRSHTHTHGYVPAWPFYIFPSDPVLCCAANRCCAWRLQQRAVTMQRCELRRENGTEIVSVTFPRPDFASSNLPWCSMIAMQSDRALSSRLRNTQWYWQPIAMIHFTIGWSSKRAISVTRPAMPFPQIAREDVWCCWQVV